jgi:hypothetical protein
MKKLFSRRPYFSFPGLVVTLALALTSCSNASERQEAKPAALHITPYGWQSICLGRFLIDLPGPIQMGAIEEKYNSTYGFDGVNDIGTKGVSWGKVTLAETPPTTLKVYRDEFYDGASAKRKIGDVYKSWYADRFREREEAIRYETKRAQSGTPDDMAVGKEMVEDKKNLLKAARYSFKVSGKAKLEEPHAFAFRRGNEYSAGYLDEVDKRVRVLEGVITRPQLESPEAAAFEYFSFRRIYHRRAPTDIPITPGFCTPFGLIDEAAGPEPDTLLEIPFRSLKYPNLIFRLSVAPADPDGKRNIQKQPNMDADRAPLHVIGVKGSYGPVAVNILGTPGRSVGFEYGPNCSRTSCRPMDQAYEFEAQTFGEPGRPDQPNLTLYMIAATSDDYKLKRTPEPGNPGFNTPSRPALSGHVPPTFNEGVNIFEQVLRSIRLRPGAIAAPEAAAQQQSVQK